MTDTRKSAGDRHVHVIGTGGTVANVTGEYDTPEAFLPAADLVEEVPGVAEVGEITTADITRRGSASLTPDIWLEIHAEIARWEASADPPDGYVVPHGSNTAEETAYFLNLTAPTDSPVVLTAAMRGLNDTGSEARRNFRDAVRVAATPDAARRGTLFVANEEIHHARAVTKVASTRPDAWASPGTGPVGLVDPDQSVTFLSAVERETAPNTPFDIAGLSPAEFPLQNVSVVFSSLAADGTLAEAAVAADAAGIVVAGFPTGLGAKSPGGDAQSDALQHAAANNIPVVMCTRGFEGRIPPDSLDDYPGEYGIGGDTLRPQKARILLALGLTITDDPGTLREYFAAY